MRKIYMLIGGSAVAMLLLIGFQVYWLKTSKQLIEEQFTNKVSMALCTAIDKMSTAPVCRAMDDSACAGTASSCSDQIHQLINDSSFKAVLKSTMSFYQIDLPYQVKVATQDTAKEEAPPFSCSLMPIVAKDDQWLQLIFQGKQDYFHSKIGFTVWTSFLIVLLILSLFIYAARSLLRQQKISEDNRHFFNHMTHEFSTPLTNIQLASKMIAKNHAPDRHATYLDIIDQQCTQLKHQVENVLQLASAEQRQFQLNRESVNLPELVCGAVESMKMQIQEKNAIVHVHPIRQACHIRGDRQHLHNVFRNLIDNALKYCTIAPRVEIDFYPNRQGWCARFRDNGLGITPGDQHKIFDRFYRGTAVGDRNMHGFGIGLAYVKKILQLHQGDIRLEPGNAGACFEIYIPNS